METNVEALKKVIKVIDPIVDTSKMDTSSKCIAGVADGIESLSSEIGEDIADLNDRVIANTNGLATANASIGVLRDSLDGKQNVLSAGNGITIVDDIISAIGGGAFTVDTSTDYTHFVVDDVLALDTVIVVPAWRYYLYIPKGSPKPDELNVTSIFQVGGLPSGEGFGVRVVGFQLHDFIANYPRTFSRTSSRVKFESDGSIITIDGSPDTIIIPYTVYTRV